MPDPIIHTGFHGYVLWDGSLQRYGNFKASGDSGYSPTPDALGQYDQRGNAWTKDQRVMFDVAQDQFGNLYATNISPE